MPSEKKREKTPSEKKREKKTYVLEPEPGHLHLTASTFDAFVKRQQTEQQEEEGLSPKQELEQWLGYLHALYEQIRGYTQTYIESGAVQIEYHDIPLNEDFIGAYTAQKMLLKIGRSTVTFTPIGTMLIGTKGRVDVQGPIGSARLSLVNKQVTTARQLVQVTIRRPGEPPPAPASLQAVKHIEWVWKISTPPPEMKFIELTQETFFEMILAVANA